ncbi:hypothetical protein J6590_048531 [Homalodisca vitripennis]|nr:hypothetical protein J6590_048531 [Homalodisca vitripennis]
MVRMIRDMLLDSEDDPVEDDPICNRNKTHFVIRIQKILDQIYGSEDKFLADNNSDPYFDVRPSDEDVSDAEYDYDRPSTSTMKIVVNHRSLECPIPADNIELSHDNEAKNNITTDSEPGRNNVDSQPQLPVFNELSGVRAAIDDTSTAFDI